MASNSVAIKLAFFISRNRQTHTLHGPDTLGARKNGSHAQVLKEDTFVFKYCVIGGTTAIKCVFDVGLSIPFP